MKKRFKKFILMVLVAAIVVSGAAFWSADEASAVTDLNLAGTTAVVYCKTTNDFIYEYNPTEVRDLASITKLLTCLIAVEKLNLTDTCTINGTEVSVEEALYRALLPSDNDAAVALCNAVSGSREEFIILMNERAREIGCSAATEFNNSSGLYGYNKSTAHDVALIAAAALENETVRKISGTAEYTLTDAKYEGSRKIVNRNFFLEGGSFKASTGRTMEVKKHEGVFGGKTGTTSDSHTSMVVGCNFNGLECYCVVLNSTYDYRYQDIQHLLDFTETALTPYSAFEKDAVFEAGKIWYGAENKIVGKASVQGLINLAEGQSPALVTAKAVYKDKLKAPIQEGQVIGEINIYVADKCLRTVDLLAAKDVKKGWFLSRFRISNTQTLIIFAVLIILIGLFVAIVVLRRRAAKRRAAARRERLMKLARQQLMENSSRTTGWPY